MELAFILLSISLLTSGLYGQQLEDSDSGRSEPLSLVDVRLWAFLYCAKEGLLRARRWVLLIATSSWFVPLSK